MMKEIRHRTSQDKLQLHNYCPNHQNNCKTLKNTCFTYTIFFVHSVSKVHLYVRDSRWSQEEYFFMCQKSCRFTILPLEALIRYRKTAVRTEQFLFCTQCFSWASMHRYAYQYKISFPYKKKYFLRYAILAVHASLS